MNESTDNDEQQRIAALIGSIDVEAPASLHGYVRGHVARAGPRQRVWVHRRMLLGGLAGAAALVVALVLALGSSSGPTAPPTVLQASTLGLRASTRAAPEENPRAHGQLAISAAGIPYPYWERSFGWHAAGVRTDHIGGRTITTVFYATSSKRRSAPPTAERIGYSIVDGQALAIPAGSQPAVWHGVRFDVLHPAGATTVVTWRRKGHTCILVGSRVSAKALLTLANWQAA
jgi:hypothetical protein